MPPPYDPIPWIRRIMVGGFISANLGGVSYLTATWHLAYLLTLPALGCAMGLGLLGMLFGMLIGLSWLKILEFSETGNKFGWHAVAASWCTSFAIGLLGTTNIVILLDVK